MITKEKACPVAASTDPKINARTHYNVIHSIKKRLIVGMAGRGLIPPSIASWLIQMGGLVDA